MSQNTVVLTANNGSLVYIVGITQSSERSQEEIALVINTVKPNSVVVELCWNRRVLLSVDGVGLPAITSSSRVSKGLINSIREIGFFSGICEQLVLNILCHESHMLQATEYHRAAIEAKKYCNHLCLGDRPLSITISRLISMLGWIRTIKFIVLIYSHVKNPVNEEEILDMTENNPTVKNLLIEVASNYSEVAEVLVEERNKCFTYVLQKHAGIQIEQAGILVKEDPKIVVGVVGLNHIPCILKYWGNITKEEYEKLSTVLPESRTTKAITFVCKVSIYSILLWGIIKTSKVIKQIFSYFYTCSRKIFYII